ncbi:MAG: hypothetical protein WBE76_22555 [Terracidiphilus sp.]
MKVAFDLYDFTDNKEQSVIRTWAADEGLSKRDIGQLNQKIDMLQINGFDLHPNLLAGPINKQKHVYKLVIHGQRMLRPMLCKGPFNMDAEFTFLLGAIEINFKLDRDPANASANREILIANPKRRIPHERY